MRGEVEMRNQPHGSCLTLGTDKEDREPRAGANEACPCGLRREGSSPELLGWGGGEKEEGGCSAWGLSSGEVDPRSPGVEGHSWWG